MRLIRNTEYGGERPLYKERDLRLEGVTIHLGESSLKETANIEAERCTFEGKYVFWECRGFSVVNCLFRESARSSLWYSSDCRMERCLVEAPKLFRRMSGISVRGCRFTKAEETLWDCDGVSIEDTRIEEADYLGMHTDNVRVRNLRLEGNYAFQYSRHVEIHDSVLNSKDALWDAEDVAIYDSVINGEYFAWYARRLRLVRCHITGEQPLCYCEDLVMEDCTMGDDAILAFEYSTIEATLRGFVHSIKNPTSGSIEVSGRIGETIINADQKQPSDCRICCTPPTEEEPTH